MVELKLNYMWLACVWVYFISYIYKSHDNIPIGPFGTIWLDKLIPNYLKLKKIIQTKILSFF